MSALARHLASRPKVCPHPTRAYYPCEYLWGRGTVWMCRECVRQFAWIVTK